MAVQRENQLRKSPDKIEAASKIGNLCERKRRLGGKSKRACTLSKAKKKISQYRQYGKWLLMVVKRKAEASSPDREKRRKIGGENNGACERKKWKTGEENAAK